ncbi:hypothetical protein AJ79_08023 [Helicocarpus griseus UAMH5409]|uniref:Uncharacterized protein n=1 Tax=Helicocarpus griseus UAMH5409 TaxID=1447875 RepID=A0A2B7WNU8_9EURO|nr:hypothetical protein AJ79_08023 [Helicocarpus griseus UAMH5409]
MGRENRRKAPSNRKFTLASRHSGQQSVSTAQNVPTKIPISVTEKESTKAPHMRTYSVEDVWEKERLGVYWMDGTPLLDPRKHPLWKGFLGTNEILAGKFPPFYRTLTLEQYRVLERLVKRRISTAILVRLYGIFWPRHFDRDGRPKGESTALFDQKTAKNMEVKMQVLTYHCNGRPQINMPDNMKNVLVGAEQNTTLIRSGDLLEENKLLKAQECELRQLIGTLEKENQKMREQWTQMSDRHKIQIKDYEYRIHLEKAKNRTSTDDKERQEMLTKAKEILRHVEDLEGTIRKGLTSHENKPETAASQLPAPTASPGKKRSLSQVKAKENVTIPEGAQERVQAKNNEPATLCNDETLGPPSFDTLSGARSAQRQRAVKRLKAADVSEDEVNGYALSFSRLYQDSPDSETRSPAEGNPKKLHPHSAIQKSSKEDIQGKNVITYGTPGNIAEQRELGEIVMIGSDLNGVPTCASLKKRRKSLPGEPDYTGAKIVSNKLHPNLYELVRTTKYSALAKFSMVSPQGDTPSQGELSRAEKLFALVLWQGYQSKIEDLLQEIDIYKGESDKRNTTFRNSGFTNGDPLPLTQTALSKPALDGLRKLALKHLEERNQKVKKDDLQCVLREPFQYASIRELTDDTVMKGLLLDAEELVQKYISILKPRFEKELFSNYSKQVPTLLVFTPKKLSSRDWQAFTYEVFAHLDQQNKHVNGPTVFNILAEKEEFTLRQLTGRFEAQGWKCNKETLANAIYKYDATYIG